MTTLTLLQSLTLFKNHKILWFGLFWSQIQWTENETSDYDINIVLESIENLDSQLYFSENWIDYNFNIFTVSQFIEKLNNYDISILESYFSPISKFNFTVDFQINLQKLRIWISSTSDNSWVKCKKKLILDWEDKYTWYKSLYHSFRIIDIWIQLAKYWKVCSFTNTKSLYFEIMSEKLSWDQLNEKYKEKWNKSRSEFKLLAPKI